MLKISKLADYGTVIMVQMAMDRGMQTARAISIRTKISLPTVTKILKLFTAAKLLKSTLGNRGGYELVKSAADITVLEIIQAIEGELSLTECSKALVDCSIFSHCSITNHWRVINGAVKNALRDITLAQLMVEGTPLTFNKQNIITNKSLGNA